MFYTIAGYCCSGCRCSINSVLRLKTLFYVNNDKMEQRILYDFYKEIEVPANGEIELDFKSNNEINQFLPFKNGFIFNLENKRIKFYVNRRDNPRILIESGFVELNNSDLIHLKIKNDNETSHKIIITCNNDYTELELLSILAGIKK